MTNIFEKAVRNKFRFASVQGDLTTEDLFDLPIETTKNNRASLYNVGQTLYTSLKSLQEDSFMPTQSTESSDVEYALEVVKYVISVKEEENAAAKSTRDNQALRAKLIEAKARKQEDSLLNMSEEDIDAKLAELN